MLSNTSKERIDISQLTSMSFEGTRCTISRLV
nr:MAG TPA: hypothetical protein [Caudoviricetes sp.]